MYNNNVKADIYLIDIYKNGYIRHLKNLDEAIDFLARFKSGRLHWWDRLVKNDIEYLDKINLNGKDIYALRIYENSAYVWRYFVRRYMFIDSYDRILDMRIYKEEINKRAKEILDKEKKKECEELERGDTLIKWKGGQPFRYRIDPVPGTGNFGHGSCYRHPRTTQETRDNASDKYKDFTRGKRRHLPTTYDDIYRTNGNSKSWKNQGKHRHQWQKNSK